MLPCVPLKVAYKDQCKFDVLQCRNVSQGSTCSIRCRSPYFGVDEVASCPAFNTDPKQQLLHAKLNCIFQCPDMAATHVPAGGYFKEDVNASWECSAGHTGVPRFTCYSDPATCVVRRELVGCKLLRPCLVPQVDGCRVETSNCVGLQQGSTCQASCKSPYVGSAVTGSCQALNTDPARLLEWSVQPKCECPFPSSSEIPKGHQRNGTSWSCSTGYAGIVAATCIQSPDCSVTWNIRGCLKTVPCKAPATLFATMPDQCQIVEAGATCLARCLPTTCVAGGPLHVHCPSTNTDRQTIASVAGQCRVRCEVCSMGQLWDIDSRKGYLSGNLPFGPAHAEGGVLTSGIEGYSVYFATTCLEKIGGAIVNVSSNSSEPRACCMPDQFLAVLDGERIPSEEATRLLVTIHTSEAGELPVGIATNFTDRAWNFTKRGGSGTVQTGQAAGYARCSLLALVAAIVFSSVRCGL